MNQERLHDVQNHHSSDDLDPLFMFIIDPLCDHGQVQVDKPDRRVDRARDVAFARVLASLTPHEVLRDHNCAELVSFEPKERHVIEA